MDAQITSAEAQQATTIQASCLFYARLVKEELDAAYYGERVTPDMPNAVLMRWKDGEGAYRVMFGDLRIETLSGEALKGLEAKVQSPEF